MNSIDILSEDVGASFVHGITGNKLVTCPFCKSSEMEIEQISVMNKNKSVFVEDAQIIISDGKGALPKIIDHHKNFKHEENDKTVLVVLLCHSFDCPKTTILLHMHKKGVSVEFSLPLANLLRIKNNFLIREETKGIVLFKNKSMLEITKLVNSQVMQNWLIGQKSVTIENSNFFAYFVEKVTTTGVPISSWKKNR